MSETKGRDRDSGGKAKEAAPGPPPEGPPDPAELARQMADRLAEIAEKSQRLVADFLARQGKEADRAAGGTAGGPVGGDEVIGLSNPTAIGAAFLEMTARMMSDPARLKKVCDPSQ